MKKLLAVLAFTSFLFAGCGTASEQSFLDEKIKCKKLADERFEEIEKNYSDSFSRDEISYSQKLNTCLIGYSYSIKTLGVTVLNRKIEDILSNKIVFETMISSDEVAELMKQKEDDFNKKLKLYFGEDAE